MLGENERKYLEQLSKKYPNVKSATSEIITLSAILNLPKGTEHFMSDIHGEHEAFLHIRRNASGVIRNKIEKLFARTVTASEREELSTIVYYPREKLDEIRDLKTDLDDWYYITLTRLLELCRRVSSKYTRSKVRRHLERTAGEYYALIDELINLDYENTNKTAYYECILRSIIKEKSAEDFITAVSSAIKSMVVDHLHIVGDIFDRGPRADIILDELTKEMSLDIQWGNHDALWMGAASGSRTCIATVLNNSITYKNLDVVEIGYGISLRPLSLFANKVYEKSDVTNYAPKGNSGGNFRNQDDDALVARMHKAISVIQFKLEGQTILRNPEFGMQDRLLLDRIDWDNGTVSAYGNTYKLKDTDFPTVDRNNPYALTKEEEEVMIYLKNAFMRSEKLQRHISFLFEKGEIYTVYNGNLLFHGCIPLNDDGSFMEFPFAKGKRGRALMDFCDKIARKGYFAPEGTSERNKGKDFLWFLWCGKDSPLCARKKIATFERLLIEDKEAWDEPKNKYYSSWNDENIVEMILKEFSLGGERSHIINGHIPVKKSSGESPVKANGKLILIDGGFCKAYQGATGIAGYTLIYNADGMRISAHESFRGKENAIRDNSDILSETVVFEHSTDKIRIKDTDKGSILMDRISDLKHLVACYRAGVLREKYKIV